MFGNFLNKFNGCITVALKNFENIKEKVDFSFQETPTRLIIKRNKKTVYDLNKPTYKPTYKLIDSLVYLKKSYIP